MKKILLLSFLILGFIVVQAQGNSPKARSNSIAKRMRDSLSLSEWQKDSIYKITIQLLQTKVLIRQSADSIVIKDFVNERLRDELYKKVLTNEQFLLFQEKKHNIINQ